MLYRSRFFGTKLKMKFSWTVRYLPTNRHAGHVIPLFPLSVCQYLTIQTTCFWWLPTANNTDHHDVPDNLALRSKVLPFAFCALPIVCSLSYDDRPETVWQGIEIVYLRRHRVGRGIPEPLDRTRTVKKFWAWSCCARRHCSDANPGVLVRRIASLGDETAQQTGI